MRYSTARWTKRINYRARIVTRFTTEQSSPNKRVNFRWQRLTQDCQRHAADRLTLRTTRLGELREAEAARKHKGKQWYCYPRLDSINI
jgi:hypothetical protein